MTEQNLNAMVEEQRMLEEAEDQRRYLLVEIVDKRDEIQEICYNTIKAIKADFPEYEGEMWESIVLTAIQFMKSTIEYLSARKTTLIQSIELDVGESFTIGIEYTAGLGEKDGSFNPYIYIGNELKIDNPLTDQIERESELGDDIQLKWLPSTIKTNITEIKDISNDTIASLKRKYKATVPDWGLAPLATVYFLRELKNWLDANKEGHEVLEIPVANTFIIGVEAVMGDDEDTIEYHSYITPGQKLKLESKSDKLTELE